MVLRHDRNQFWDDHDYWIRYSTRRGRPEASLFFRTRGCRHDLAGGCSMCDYGAGPPISSAYMINAVQRALSDLPDDLNHLLFSPSGSFLDKWEIPSNARDGILGLIASTAIPHLSFETRAETLSDESLDVCCTSLADQKLNIYVGLESADPWVSHFAINKQIQIDDFLNALNRLQQRSISSSVNVLIGAPFLSRLEVIEDAVATVHFALKAGASHCCIFPIHVKRWTQIGWLYDHNYYEPPTLWALIEVLWRLGEQICSSHIEIAWYTSYGAFNIMASPTTCPICVDKVIALLDTFAATNDFSAIRRAITIDCNCRQAWQESLTRNIHSNRIEAAAFAYDKMATALLPQSWWEQHRAHIMAELKG